MSLADMFILLGPFRFSAKMIAPQTVEEKAGYRWAENARLGTSPAMHFEGINAEEMTLPGVIYPHYREHGAGLTQLRLMKEAASVGTILPMITGGNGYYHGFWVITDITTSKSYMMSDSTPLKVEFSITLKKYGDGLEAIRRKGAAEFGKLVTRFT